MSRNSFAPVIEASGLGVSFVVGQRRVDAVHEVSLTVRAGELVAVLGPSGAGKSTLLHALGALRPVTAGTLRVGGLSVADLDERGLAAMRLRTVGTVFQQLHLVGRLDLLDNVAVPAILAGAPRRRARALARAMIEAVGLGHRLDHRPHELSGGEQQRAAVARALVNEPRVLLADEPTGSLDADTAAGVLELIASVPGPDRAVVLVTHDLDVCARACRVVRMQGGRLVADPSPGPALGPAFDAAPDAAPGSAGGMAPAGGAGAG